MLHSLTGETRAAELLQRTCLQSSRSIAMLLLVQMQLFN
jgi:hypothetical protein